METPGQKPGEPVPEPEKPGEPVPREPKEEKTNDIYDSYFLFFHKNKEQPEYMYVQPFMYKNLLHKDTNNMNSPKAILEPRTNSLQEDDVFIYYPDPDPKSALKRIAKVERSKVFTAEFKDGKVAFTFMMDTLFQKIDEGVIQLPPIKKYAVSKDEFRLERVFENDEQAKRDDLKQEKNVALTDNQELKKQKAELEEKIIKLQKENDSLYEFKIDKIIDNSTKIEEDYKSDEIKDVGQTSNSPIVNFIKKYKKDFNYIDIYINQNIKAPTIKLVGFKNNNGNYDDNSFFACLKYLFNKNISVLKDIIIGKKLFTQYQTYYEKIPENTIEKYKNKFMRFIKSEDRFNNIVNTNEFPVTNPEIIDLIMKDIKTTNQNTNTEYSVILTIFDFKKMGNEIIITPNTKRFGNLDDKNKCFIFMARDEDYHYFIMNFGSNNIFFMNDNNIPIELQGYAK